MNDPETHPLGKLLQNYPTLDFLGKQMTDEVASAIAKGEIDPMSHRKYETPAALSQDGS